MTPRQEYMRRYRAANRAKEKVREAGRKSYKRDYMRKRYASQKGRLCEESRARHRQNPIKNMLMCAKRRAAERGLAFDLSVEDVVIPAVCPVLGIKIEVGRGGRAPGSPSVDRIDNAQGYVKGNIQVISWRANDIKGDATPGELRAVLAYVEAHEF